MSDIIDKVKEKVKDVKDKVVDNTKDVIDAAKDSFDTPTIPSSNAYFHGPESKYEEDNSSSSIEIKNSGSPLTEHRKRETILSENTKDNGLINTSTTITSNVTATRNQIGKQQQQYDDKQNNEFFNPFIISMKLWQNYYKTWMNFYIGALESFNRTIRNI
jgi:gas vesicle protein